MALVQSTRSLTDEEEEEEEEAEKGGGALLFLGLSMSFSLGCSFSLSFRKGDAQRGKNAEAQDWGGAPLLFLTL